MFFNSTTRLKVTLNQVLTVNYASLQLGLDICDYGRLIMIGTLKDYL